MHNVNCLLGQALTFNTRYVGQLTTKELSNTYHVPVLVPIWVTHTSEACTSGAFSVTCTSTNTSNSVAINIW